MEKMQNDEANRLIHLITGVSMPFAVVFLFNLGIWSRLLGDWILEVQVYLLAVTYIVGFLESLPWIRARLEGKSFRNACGVVSLIIIAVICHFASIVVFHIGVCGAIFDFDLTV